jgi:hypothetical protein
MKKLWIMIFLASMLSACADGRFVKKTFLSGACGGGGFQGYTVTLLRYGDSRLMVVPISKIRPNAELRFQLVPKVRDTDGGVVFKDAFISIDSDDDDGDTPANWLKASGTFNADNGALTVCVPPTLLEPSYKYTVTVHSGDTDVTPVIGMLDPRANVIID